MYSPDSQAERATGDLWDVLQLLVLRVPAGEAGEAGGEEGGQHIGIRTGRNALVCTR